MLVPILSGYGLYDAGSMSCILHPWVHNCSILSTIHSSCPLELLSGGGGGKLKSAKLSIPTSRLKICVPPAASLARSGELHGGRGNGELDAYVSGSDRKAFRGDDRLCGEETRKSAWV